MRAGKILLALSLVLFLAAFVIWFVGEKPAAPVETQPSVEATTPETTVPETTVPATTVPETTAPPETVVIPDAPENITAESWQKNHLFAFDSAVYGCMDGSLVSERPVLGSGYKRSQIRTVTFLDTLEDAPETAWYVGVEGREDHVLAWVEPNGELYDLYIGAWGGINGRDYSEYLFAGFENLEEVTFGGNYHTEWSGSVLRMFLGCSSLQRVDVENLNTYNVSSMEGMFEGCRSLTEVQAGAMDTTHLIITSQMFKGCESLRSVDLGKWDTDELFRCDEMFMGCGMLEELDLGGLDTSEVVNMERMFQDCASLRKLDLTGFDTGKAEFVSGIFENCPAGSEWQHLLK